jgi:hypothetical protein
LNSNWNGGGGSWWNDELAKCAGFESEGRDELFLPCESGAAIQMKNKAKIN